MNPLKVRAVKRNYDPGYPRFVEIENWRELVRPSSQRVFARATLLFAGLFGGAFFVDANVQAQDEPKTGKPLEASNEEAAKIANAALDRVKASGTWYEGSTEVQAEVIGSNPKISVPEIAISFGNSHIGVFDLVNAKKATVDLFAAYGVHLKAGYKVKRDGIEFEADGYDPEKDIGFEIMGSENPPLAFGGRVESGKEEDQSVILDKQESAKLKELVGEEKVKMFLVPVENYPNMDGDQYTPLRSYLKSVLDYLDWLKKQGTI